MLYVYKSSVPQNGIRHSLNISVQDLSAPYHYLQSRELTYLSVFVYDILFLGTPGLVSPLEGCVRGALDLRNVFFGSEFSSINPMPFYRYMLDIISEVHLSPIFSI